MTISLRLAAGAALLAAGPALAGPTVVYSNNFDGAATTAGGTVGVQSGAGDTTALNPVGGFTGNGLVNTTGGGGQSGTESVFTLTNLPTHTSIDVNFLLAFLDSWDGQGNSYPVGDYLDVSIDGSVVATLSVYNYNYDATPPLYAGATFVANGELNNNFQGINDRVVDMSTVPTLNFAHSASTLTLGIVAYGPGWQGGTDESWAIDNLSIVANVTNAGAVPEPAGWATMISGFGLVGGALRRRARPATLPLGA